MLIIRAIYNILSAYQPLVDLVGERIYPVQAPQQRTWPFVVFTVNESTPINRLSGRACADRVFTEYVIVSQTIDEAITISSILRDALDWVTPGTYSGVSLGRTQFTNLVGPQHDDDEDKYIINMVFDTIVNNAV